MPSERLVEHGRIKTLDCDRQPLEDDWLSPDCYYCNNNYNYIITILLNIIAGDQATFCCSNLDLRHVALKVCRL